MSLVNAGLTNTVDNASANWGSVTGSISSQTDLYQGLAGIAIIDMGAADYTMSPSEALAYIKIVSNVGNGTKTLTWPSGSDSKDFSAQLIANQDATQFTAALQSGGSTETIFPNQLTEVAVAPGVGVFSMGYQYAIAANNVSNGVSTIGGAATNATSFYSGKLLVFTSAAAQTLTINSANYFWPDTKFDVLVTGAGGLTVSCAGTFVLAGSGTVATNQRKTIWRDDDTNNWYIG